MRDTRSTVAVAALLSLALTASVARAQGTPTLEGPITGPGVPFVAGTNFDLAPFGYVEEEYFISGTASAYTNVGPLTSDGIWTVTPGDIAEYKTRILVIRPTSRGRFNGTVVVEWLNVSGGLDASPDWTMAHTELIREGYAWVGVSAQIRGIEGSGGLGLNLSLKAVNPARYGVLVHPGDSFSYDMLSQVGQAIRDPVGASPLGDLPVRRVIAVGESQSAFRLVTYINAIHPVTEIYDGFLVHSRGAGSAALSQDPQPAIRPPSSVLIRPDLDVPVLTFQAETDVTLLGSFFDRQPDTDRIRLWEVAGTAHADTYTLLLGSGDEGDNPDIVEPLVSHGIPGIIECATPINSGPHHFVLKAAYHALERWVRLGQPPASAPLIEVALDPDPVIVRDEDGNASGGIRTPQLDVPIATHSGEGQTGSAFCFLFGSTVLFDEAKLAELYPSHRDFVRAFERATRQALHNGWIRRLDARLMREWARASEIGG